MLFASRHWVLLLELLGPRLTEGHPVGESPGSAPRPEERGSDLGFGGALSLCRLTPVLEVSSRPSK